jgi:DNA (cytosine-5)-methyltransferase 1
MSENSQQLSFLAPDSDAPNWFNAMLRELNVTQKPGWPDAFGSSLRRWLQENGVARVPTLSLFSGGGGLDIAFHDAGFDIVELVEIDPRFAATLAENAKPGRLLAGGNVICADIRTYNPSADLKVDFIIGGPPCQTFSAAGRRASGVKGTSDPRGTLFEDYVRILKQLRPKAFLFENVYGIVGAEGGEPWKQIQAAFCDAGYDISLSYSPGCCVMA